MRRHGRSVANFSKSLIGGHTNHRNGEEWTGMDRNRTFFAENK